MRRSASEHGRRRPEVVSVNVGTPKTVQAGTRTVTTAIWKTPVDGRVQARGVNLDGDAQADRANHGGPDKAIYAYAFEDTEHWERHFARALGAGAMGENLTTRGIDPNRALIGERWAVGSTILEVSEPRSPCFRLGLRHDEPALHRAFVAAQRPGTYLRIIEAGDIGAGDHIDIVSRPDHDVTVLLAFQAWHIDRSLINRLRAAPQLSQAWKDWINSEPLRRVKFE